jgi:hypothetical protein
MKTKRGPGRPKLPEKDQLKNYTVRLTPIVIEMLGERAKDQNVSTSIFARQVLINAAIG